jgi:hypothetical protein
LRSWHDEQAENEHPVLRLRRSLGLPATFSILKNKS